MIFKLLNTTKPSMARRMLVIITILVASLLLRLEMLKLAQNIARDGATYLNMAHELTERPWEAVFRDYDYHPGYAVSVAAVAQITNADWPNGWVWSAQCISVAMSLLTLLGIYIIGAEVFDDGIALVGMLIFALADRFLEVSCDVISGSQAVAMGVWAIALALYAARLLREGKAWAIAPAALAGLAGGLGYLTRPEELLGSIVAVTVLVAAAWRTDSRRRRIQIVALAAVIVTTLMCVLPYAIAIGNLTQKKSTEDFVLAGGGPILAMVGSLVGAFKAFIEVVNRSNRAAGHVMTALIVIWAATWFGRYVLRLNLPKTVLIMPNRLGALATAGPFFLMWLLLGMLEYHRGPDYISSRHMMYPAALVAPYAGAGLAIILQWVLLGVDRLKWPRMPGVTIAVALILVAGLSIWQGHFTLHEGKTTSRRAGNDIREQFGPGHYCLAMDGRIPLFAAAPSEQFRTDSTMPFLLTPEDLLSIQTLQARIAERDGKQYTFICISSEILPETADECPDEKIIQQMIAHRQFQRITDYPCPKNRKIWMFRITPPQR